MKPNIGWNSLQKLFIARSVKILLSDSGVSHLVSECEFTSLMMVLAPSSER